MERSAQFVSNFAGFSEGSSLTTFALADAPDSHEEPTGKVIQLCRFPAQKTDKTTEFKEKMCSSVDDYIGLESELALRRVRETL
jgi:hypothetical protein